MLFLANKLSKMKHNTTLGSRIAEVHNGSSLFTGDAGQGESNIRRWIIENDWLEAIVALPLNMFYNTGIATYIWVLTNRKPEHRQGKVQLIDATAVVPAPAQEPRQEELRAGRGRHPAHLRHLPRLRGNRAEQDLPQPGLRLLEGHRRAPLRLKGVDPNRVYKAAEIKKLREDLERSEDAPPVIKKIHKKGTAADPLRGLFEVTIGGSPLWSSTSPTRSCATPSRCRSKSPAASRPSCARGPAPRPGRLVRESSVKIGYEISFTRYFYKPQPMRTLEEIRADILALEKETEGLLSEILEGFTT
jgi:type I restriction enzyme M protein